MKAKAKILLIEDNYYCGNATRNKLEEHGYEVVHCANGEAARKYLDMHIFNICLIEILLPDNKGSKLVAEIRKKNDTIPIFLLTANATIEDSIESYTVGADVHLTKPFSLQELLLRIEVWRRRTVALEASITREYKFEKGIVFSYHDRNLIQSGKRILVTEYLRNLMRYFMDNPNISLRRDEIAVEVWGKSDYFVYRSMDVFITRIRSIFKDCPSVELRTIPCIGFIFLVSDMKVFENNKMIRRIKDKQIDATIRALPKIPRRHLRNMDKVTS